MNQNHEQPSARRIVLPSGRSIEVIRFDDTHSAERVFLHAIPAPQRQLHRCPECDCDLVHPVSWNQVSDDEWELCLECPNCWWSTEGTFASPELHELEEHLDAGLADMLSDLKRLCHANLAEQIERFVAALNADLILPEDF